MDADHQSYAIMPVMEQRIPQRSGIVTEQDYLRLEELALSKHEFRDGRVIDMAGGTGNHALIAMSLGGEIRQRLKRGPCKVFSSDLRVRINEIGNYCYPDLTVACEPLVYIPPDKQTNLVNPKLVVEITSPTSEADDRGDKFSDYRLIPSLEEYVLVSQERYQVETFYRQSDGIWAFGPSAHGIDQSIAMRCLDIKLPLAEIYAGIELPPAAQKPISE
jgi:Uma2 family endonuclease